jgi:hypothetical protein
MISVRAQLLHRYSLLLGTMEIFGMAFRSFREHTRIQPAKDSFVDLTPPALPGRNEGLTECVRINARLAGIEQLKTTHPWVDLVDQKIYLLGFDEAERWSAARNHTEDTSAVLREPS